MYFKTEGLVLRETEYQDADKLLTVLTKDRGKLTLRARGVRSRNSRLKSGCQLLAYSEFTVYEGRNTQSVQEAVPFTISHGGSKPTPYGFILTFLFSKIAILHGASRSRCDSVARRL